MGHLSGRTVSFSRACGAISVRAQLPTTASS
jgi:hypothetical protein